MVTGPPGVQVERQRQAAATDGATRGREKAEFEAALRAHWGEAPPHTTQAGETLQAPSDRTTIYLYTRTLALCP